MADVQTIDLATIGSDTQGLDGAVVELTATSDHLLVAEIRIPGPAA